MIKRFYIFLIFLFSCTSIQEAIITGKPVVVSVEHHGDAWTDPTTFYTTEIKKSGEDYEFHVTKNDTLTIYKLPPNKLTLFYGMEEGFKDLNSNTSLSYYRIIVSAGASKRNYKINTDLIANFIKGLKRK